MSIRSLTYNIKRHHKGAEKGLVPIYAKTQTMGGKESQGYSEESHGKCGFGVKQSWVEVSGLQNRLQSPPLPPLSTVHSVEAARQAHSHLPTVPGPKDTSTWK